MNKLLIFIGFVLLFASCNKSNNLKLGFMVPNYEIARYTKDKDYFSEKAKELGAEVLVANAEDDDKKQYEQAMDLIAQGVNVLVIISINLNTSAAIVREAHDNGVKVIAYERLIQNCDLDYFVAFNGQNIGTSMANYAIKLKPEGNYVLIGGDKADKNAISVKEGQLQVIEPSVKEGKIKVLYDIYIEDWKAENAQMEMERILKLTDEQPDVVLVSNDGMAQGVVNALTKFNLDGRVVVTGQDADLYACKRIIAGTQAMTIYKPLKAQGYIAAEMAVKLAKNEKMEVITTVNNGQKEVASTLLNPVSVDNSNMKETIVKDNFHTEKDIYE